MSQSVSSHDAGAPTAPRRAILALALAFLVHPFVSAAIAEQARTDFPERPMSLVVPFPAGGRTDLNARIIADAMAGPLGQPVQVVNRVGAGGTVAARQVLTSKPDGHTLLFTSAALLISSYTIEGAPGLADFEPIAIVSETSPVVFARQDSGWKTVSDLVAAARQNPDALSIGGIVGGTSQVMAAGFMQAADIKMTIVPFKGDADAIIALAGGHIDAYISGLPSAKSMLDAGKVRALAVVGSKALPALPGVVPLKEAGIDFNGSLFDAVLAPKQSAEPVIDKLETVLKRVMNDPAVMAKAAAIGLDFVFVGRTEAKGFLKSQDALYAETLKSLRLNR